LPERPEHRDALIIVERAECSPDLAGHRPAFDFDELGLREQVGAGAERPAAQAGTGGRG